MPASGAGTPCQLFGTVVAAVPLQRLRERGSPGAPVAQAIAMIFSVKHARHLNGCTKGKSRSKVMLAFGVSGAHDYGAPSSAAADVGNSRHAGPNTCPSNPPNSVAGLGPHHFRSSRKEGPKAKQVNPTSLTRVARAVWRCKFNENNRRLRSESGGFASSCKTLSKNVLCAA